MTESGLILIGGGGHCRSAVDVIAMEGRWRITGILDRKDQIGSEVLGHRIIGDDDLIPRLAAEGHRFLITAGQVRDASLRMRLADLVRAAGGELATVVSPTARIAIGATLGPGCFIGHNAVVNTNARIGGHGIINTAALVEHDSIIGDLCHVATGAIVNGGCRVGDGSLVGSGAIVLQGVSIGQRCIVGAGALVLKDVPDGAIAIGQPARTN